MTTRNESKIKILIKSLKPGNVVLASWLKEKGFSRDLLWHYLRNDWLEPVGRGAYKLAGDTVDWSGGLAAMQQQAEINVHAGALTALSLQGHSHYFRLGKETLFLFSPYKSGLPKWFENHDWNIDLFHQETSFLPDNTGIIDFQINNVQIKVSSAERAILECLYLSPKKLDLVECYQLMDNMVNLKPKLLQEILSNCNSIKVNRLFLYMAEKAGHEWLNFLDTSNIELGSGNRWITKNGTYIAKYQITISKELATL